MRVLIIDDHPLFSDGLKLLLQTLGVAQEVQTGSRARQALELASQSEWDLILLDWNLGEQDISGAELIQALKEVTPNTRVVVVSAEAHPVAVKQAIEAGAVGFVPKETSAALLVDAIRITSHGGIFLPAVVLHGESDGTPSPQPVSPSRSGHSLEAAFPRLTRRQIDVLVCALRGEPNKSIARELGISESTVKQHLKVVYRELDVHNRSEAIYLLARQGLKVF
jgi:DNA-binding NarL/FixJ family response regulator